MKKILIVFVCVVCFCGTESRSLNATHDDIPNETQIVFATHASESDNSTTTLSSVVNLTTVDTNATRFNQTLSDDRSSKSIISEYQSKLYLDLPVNIPNNTDHFRTFNIDNFNPFLEDKNTTVGDSSSYVLKSKNNRNKFYYKSNLGYPYHFVSPYKGIKTITSLGVNPGDRIDKRTSPPPVRYNTKYPSFEYLPGATNFGVGMPQYPQITYGYPYVMDKQMQVLQTFKSLSESLFHMMYEVYFCVRYFWHGGIMKCMTGRSSLFGDDRTFHPDDGDEEDNDGDDDVLQAEPRGSGSTGATASEDDNDVDLQAEPREFSSTLDSQPDHVVLEDNVNATVEVESVGEQRKAQHGYAGGGAVSAFSSGLGSGIGNGLSHQVFTYQQPKKKKKKKKKHHHSHHSYKHILPYVVAAKAKLLSILTIVGFLAKKAWIVSSISLLLSLLSLFAKLTSKGHHRSTEVILAKPSHKDWDWDREWDRVADEPEARVKPQAYRLVPVEEPTPIPLHYFEKESENKDFYM